MVNKNDENQPKYGNLIWSNSVACATNGDIFVGDRFEHRILVFNKDFIFKYQIGGKGNLTGQFDEPTDICFNENAKLFVADKNNFRVQVFSEAKKSRESKSVKMNASFNKSSIFESTSNVYITEGWSIIINIIITIYIIINIFFSLGLVSNITTAKTNSKIKNSTGNNEYVYSNYI